MLTLKKRQDHCDRDDQDDDFRVDFKNTDELRALRDEARDNYLTLREAADLEFQRSLAAVRKLARTAG